VVLIDTAFEIGQGLKPVSLALLPEWFEVHALRWLTFRNISGMGRLIFATL